MTFKTIMAGAVPAAVGVMLAGAVFYFLGNKIPLLNEAASGFDGHRTDNTLFN